MAFDPTLPLPSVVVESAVLRGQFNALNDKIDAGAILSIVFDSLVMLPPGEAPTGSATLAGNVLHLSLSIPVGPQGPPGTNGADGGPGADGAPGSPGEVTTGTLALAIAGTAMNPANVSTLTLSNPDADIQAIVAKINEHITATKRV